MPNSGFYVKMGPFFSNGLSLRNWGEIASIRGNFILRNLPIHKASRCAFEVKIVYIVYVVRLVIDLSRIDKGIRKDDFNIELSIIF